MIRRIILTKIILNVKALLMALGLEAVAAVQPMKPRRSQYAQEKFQRRFHLGMASHFLKNILVRWWF